MIGRARALGRSLLFATEHLQHCEKCNTFTEAQICEVCSDEERDPTLLCVVETPADQIMLEQTMTYRGLYFVLMGRLARSTGSARRKSISTASCGARPMVSSRKSCSRPTSNEGEATAHYLGQTLKARGLAVTRLARGVPVGGETRVRRRGHHRPRDARPPHDVSRRRRPFAALRLGDTSSIRGVARLASGRSRGNACTFHM